MISGNCREWLQHLVIEGEGEGGDLSAQGFNMSLSIYWDFSFDLEVWFEDLIVAINYLVKLEEYTFLFLGDVKK